MMIEADGVARSISYGNLFKANSAIAVKKEKATYTMNVVFNTMG